MGTVGEDSADCVGLSEDSVDELRLVAAADEQVLGALTQETSAALDRDAA